MILDPVSCPGKIHCTAVFAEPNGKCSELGGATHLYNPLEFRPCLSVVAYIKDKLSILFLDDGCVCLGILMRNFLRRKEEKD